MENLISQNCAPAEGESPLSNEKIDEYRKELHSNWAVKEGKSIIRTFEFKTFLEGIEFVNRIARVAEQEQHHPDLIIRYNKVTLELSTHSIGGLSKNDFILAAKVDLLHKWEEKVEKEIVKRIFTVRFLLFVVVLLVGLLLWQTYF